MESIKSKPLSFPLFIILLSLIFIRPFFSGLTYPVFEFFYENFVIFLAVVTLFFLTRSESKTNPYTLPILLLLSSYLISILSSINPQNSIKETIKFISYISIFFMVLQTNSEQKKRLIKTVCAAATIIGLYAIYQYYWGYEHTLSFLKKTNPEFMRTSQYARDILIAKRSIGTFPSPNIFGGYLVIMFFLSLNSLKAGFQFERKAGFRRLRDSAFKLILHCSPILFILFALILTKSLGAWLSLIFGLILSLVLIRPHLGLILSNYSKKRLNAILILVFISIFLILFFILINRWDRLIDLQNPQNSITQRLNYWRTSLAIIKNHPFFGVGPGNFYLAFPKYKIGLSTDTCYAHNLLLHLASENGLLGLVSILLLIFIFLKEISKKVFFNADSRGLYTDIRRVAIFASILTFLFHNLIDNDYLIPEVGLLWWVLLGLSTEN